MSDTVIRVENLGKKYTIAHQKQERYKTLRDAIATSTKSLGRKLLTPFGKETSDPKYEEFWALKDVSFEIKQGDRVGIIGRNGAGKSTLLKILSRITEPTIGRISIKGRVSSLLEVGTGFHQELTGRENIYLNGAILGMSRAEISRKFDEIVAFAEVEKFLDTPVKHYSSGMYVRLAFAVAAHLDPEILIVDEVLAVGDAQFQKKCLGKMEDVAEKEGRTILFVSHNMGAVQTLCQTGYLIEKGHLMAAVPAQECVWQYLSMNQEGHLAHTALFSRPINARMWLSSATVLCDGEPSAHIVMGSTLAFSLNFHSVNPIQNPKIGFVVSSAQGETLLNANNRYQTSMTLQEPAFEGTIICYLGVVPLMENRYFISFWLGDHTGDSHFVENALSFEVIAQDIWGQGMTPPNNVSFLWWSTKFEVKTHDTLNTFSASY